MGMCLYLRLSFDPVRKLKYECVIKCVFPRKFKTTRTMCVLADEEKVRSVLCTPVAGRFNPSSLNISFHLCRSQA